MHDQGSLDVYEKILLVYLSIWRPNKSAVNAEDGNSTMQISTLTRILSLKAVSAIVREVTLMTRTMEELLVNS